MSVGRLSDGMGLVATGKKKKKKAAVLFYFVFCYGVLAFKKSRCATHSSTLAAFSFFCFPVLFCLVLSCVLFLHYFAPAFLFFSLFTTDSALPLSEHVLD